jgi:hypothetical protein
MSSKPINIPIVSNINKNNKRIAHSPSSSSSSLSTSVSASFTPTQMNIPISSDSNAKSYPPKNSKKNLILYGAPFKNKDTVSTLLQDCVKINKEVADKVIAEVEEKKYAKIITCDPIKANIYCKNLIDNGLCVLLE